VSGVLRDQDFELTKAIAMAELIDSQVRMHRGEWLAEQPKPLPVFLDATTSGRLGPAFRFGYLALTGVTGVVALAYLALAFWPARKEADGGTPRPGAAPATGRAWGC
jgi:hypothetical protein